MSAYTYQKLARTSGLIGRPSLSADGRHAGWLSADGSRVGVTLLDLHTHAETSLTSTVAARWRELRWTRMQGVALLVADNDGSERQSLYCVHTASADWIPICPEEQVRMRVVGISGIRPTELLICFGRDGGGTLDYCVFSLERGSCTRIFASSDYSAVYFDHHFDPRLVETVDNDGARCIWHWTAGRRELLFRLRHEDSHHVRFLGFSTAGAVAYFVMPHDETGAEIVGISMSPANIGARETILETTRVDIPEVLFCPHEGVPQIACLERGKQRYVALSETARDSLRCLARTLRGRHKIVEYHRDCWLIRREDPAEKPVYYYYRPGARQLRTLCFDRTDSSRRLPLSCRTSSVLLRDGLTAITYVTRSGTVLSSPRASDSRCPAAAILLIHGGPWRRSHWEFDLRRAFLAALGFTVIEPNFRGSTGFGRRHLNAGDRQWGARMQEDLETTLEWGANRGLLDPENVAAVGGSYGGYAALQLACTGRAKLRCVIATSPIVDLVEFLTAPPPYWRTALPMMYRRIGDPGSAAARNDLADKSPINHIASFECPILLAHGCNDTRTPAQLTVKLFMELKRSQKDAILALFLRDGHEVAEAKSRSILFGLMGDFLSGHLCGAPFDPGTYDTQGRVRIFSSRSADARGMTGCLHGISNHAGG